VSQINQIIIGSYIGTYQDVQPKHNHCQHHFLTGKSNYFRKTTEEFTNLRESVFWAPLGVPPSCKATYCPLSVFQAALEQCSVCLHSDVASSCHAQLTGTSLSIDRWADPAASGGECDSRLCNKNFSSRNNFNGHDGARRRK
jgi:hypothetical protein